jgi:16S rRNA (guanine966-N2)-methyltransferase
VGLRIIGGRFRGRRLRYGGEPGVRPMKDRVREALFNLVGPAVVGKHAVDLFAGTGALGLEALSRGAVGATFIERHFPTASVLRENIATLGVGDLAEVIVADAFLRPRWQPRLGPGPWLVFCSPPYAFYADRGPEMLDLIGSLCEAAPAGSLLAVESDDRFDTGLLPASATWDIRRYPPAVLGIGEK